MDHQCLNNYPLLTCIEDYFLVNYDRIKEEHYIDNKNLLSANKILKKEDLTQLLEIISSAYELKYEEFKEELKIELKNENEIKVINLLNNRKIYSLNIVSL